jgi:DNA-binding transcriptional ArsR family regulator
MENSSTMLDTAFHALSDPIRRAVIAKLTESGAITVKELAAPFPIGLPTFLKHLKVLEDSGLISSEKSGRVRTCSIQPKQLAEAEFWLSQRRKLWEERLDRFSTYVESIGRTKDTI